MKSRRSIAVINASLESSISGIRVTKAFTNAEKEREKFEDGNGQFIEARREAYNAMGQFHSTTAFVTDIFNVVVLIAGGLFLYNSDIVFGDYSAFVVSIGMFITPVMTLINFMEQYQNGVTGFERFIEIMDAAPERDADGAVDADVWRGTSSCAMSPTPMRARRTSCATSAWTLKRARPMHSSGRPAAARRRSAT